MGVVHFVAGGEKVLARFNLSAEETFAVKWDGSFDRGGFENGGADVDGVDKVAVDLAGFHFAWPAHDHGDAGAAVVEKLLPANVAASVITDEEDEGVVGETFVFESLEESCRLRDRRVAFVRGHWPSRDG